MQQKSLGAIRNFAIFAAVSSARTARKAPSPAQTLTLGISSVICFISFVVAVLQADSDTVLACPEGPFPEGATLKGPYGNGPSGQDFEE